MGADFNSTQDLRIWRLEQGARGLVQRLNQMAKDIGALQQSFMQMAGMIGNAMNAGSTSTFIAKAGSGGVPGRSGTTAGSASVTLYTMGSTGTLTSGPTVTAWNISGGTVASGSKWLTLGRDQGGRYIVLSAEC